MLNELRARIGSYFLNREFHTIKRIVKTSNLHDAKKIGVIYNARNDHHFENVKKFINSINGTGKSVMSLGFVNRKEEIGTLKGSREFNFFSVDDFNWYFRPVSPKVDNFIAQEFDILIDIRLRKSIPLLFIIALSRARMKVGRYAEKYADFYDLMIEVEKEDGLQYFINQINPFLTKLHTNNVH